MRKHEIVHVEQYEARFWQKVDRREPKECWPWKGSGEHHGQVYLGLPGYARNQQAHRMAYILTFGELEDSCELLHDCDNPPCCNPAHLFPGTHKKNMEDMGRKGRQWRSKTNPQVRSEIRVRYRRGDSASSIARAMGLSRHTVSRALNYGRPKGKLLRFGTHYGGAEEHITDLKYPERIKKILATKIDKKDNGCWEWSAGTIAGGYGLINVTLSTGKRKGEPAHRLAYLLEHGYIPPRTVIRHKCNNPPCVNPEHLLEGTHQQNMQDMYAAGRGGKRYTPEGYEPLFAYKPKPEGYRAVTHQYTRLDTEQRDEIRTRVRAGEDREKLIEEYHTSPRTLSAIMVEDGGERGQIAPLEQRQMDERAYTLRAHGLSWSKIAQQVGLSTMGARKSVLRHGPDPMPTGQTASRKRARLDDDPTVLATALQLRADGQTYKEVGAHFGVSAGAAHGLVKKAQQV